jgi:hypothetical protein
MRHYWLLLLIPAVLWGCQPVRTKTTLEQVYELDPSGKTYISPSLEEDPPRTVAILPFRSVIGGGRIEGSRSLFHLLTRRGEDSAKLAERMRQTFYGQFSQLEFDQLKISQVDHLLSQEGLDSWEKIRALPSRRLGEILGADALVFGEVTQFDYYYGFLYSQLAAGLSVEMVEARSGRILWQAHDARRDHSFRVALDPIGLAVGLFQIGFHMRPISMMRAMDEICRELVGRLPPRHFSPDKF